MQFFKRLTFFAVFSAVVASFGGLLFGYNTSVISGAILFITEDFQFTPFDQELIISTILIGALIGSLIGGYLVDKIGRKFTLFFTVILFVIGNILMILSDSLTGFLLGRFVLGLGVGIVSVAVPLYIAEISPVSHRGSLVSLNQLAITIGILLGYTIDYSFAEEANWQWMFAFAFFPTAILFLGLFFVKETPSYLDALGRKKEAREVMSRICGDKNPSCLSLEGKTEEVSPISFKHLFNKSIRGAFVAGIGMSVFQQITGINIIIYYAPRIFQLAGYESASAAIYATRSVGIVNVIMTIVALYLIDRIGRRPLLITGLIGMSISLFTLGISFFENWADIGLIAGISLMAYVAFFAISLGPVAWLIISEIYPMKIRGRAMGIAIFANWVCNYIVSLTFLNLIDALGASGTFWLYTLICLVALWFVSTKIPETKNKSFKEIQNFWKKEKAV